MQPSSATVARIVHATCRGTAILVLSGLLPAPVTQLAAETSSLSIVAVEEDWELVLGNPDPNSTAPQITCAISPTGDVDSLHGTFQINYQSLPAFVPGGLQLQVWNGDWSLDSRKFPNPDVMADDGETVRWTQTMRLHDGRLIFEVVAGNSTTWHEFGGLGYLKTSVASGLENLNSYEPAVSVQHSGVSYAANRVQSLVLKRVRVTTSSGEVRQFDSPHVVHQDD